MVILFIQQLYSKLPISLHNAGMHNMHGVIEAIDTHMYSFVHIHMHACTSLVPMHAGLDPL